MSSNSNATVNPNQLITDLLNSNWDLGTLELRSHSIDRAANSVDWMTTRRYVDFSPWPRQVQIAVNLFEDYCPDCSDMNIVQDMWGLSLNFIKSKVSLLQYGICPQCGKSRTDFKLEGKLHGVQELVGIAGQRCLGIETEVLTTQGPRMMGALKEGDLLQDLEGLTKVLKVERNLQPGRFVVYLRVPGNPQLVILDASDDHTWVTSDGNIITVELQPGQAVRCLGGWAKIVAIDKFKTPTPMVDIETSTGTFLHSSGLLLHNSGKSALTAMLSTYIGHKYLCLDGVCSNHYGLRNQLLSATFVAADKAQVSDTTWGAFADEIFRSEWYKGYFGYLDEEGKRLGFKLYEFKPETHLDFYNKRLQFGFAAPNMTTLRGRTRFLGSIDEWGWFDNDPNAKRKNGSETYSALANGLTSIRTGFAEASLRNPDAPTGYMLCVSSPQSEDDPIMTRAGTAREDKKVYSFHYASWDINPKIKREEMRTEMLADPAKFMRDFGALPGTGKNIFLPNIEVMDSNIDDERLNTVTYANESFSMEVKDTTYWYVKAVLQKLRPNREYPSMLACDAGERGNGYGMVLMHLEGDTTVIDGAISIQPRVIGEGILGSVHFPSAHDLIFEKLKQTHIEMVAYDRWQSTTIIQDLLQHNVDAKKYSLRYPDFIDFKNRYMEHNVRFPSCEVPYATLMLEVLSDATPIAQLLKQTRTVRDTGRKVTKPANGDDDLFRCVVLGDYLMHAHKGRFERRDFGSKNPHNPFGVVRHTHGTINSVQNQLGGLKAPVASMSTLARGKRG
jgi:hypothetical protein